VPLLAALFSIPLNAVDPPSDLTLQQQQQQTLTAIPGNVGALAEQQPVLLIVQDLPWVDPSTLKLLALRIAQTPTLRRVGVTSSAVTAGQAPGGARRRWCPVTHR
jgi:hypothetical protein